MPRPDLTELERRVARTGATVDNVTDLLAMARELEAENAELERRWHQAVAREKQERRGHERSLVRMGVLTSDAAGNLQAKHPDGGSDADARRRELEADLDAARAELAQRGELVGWVVAWRNATGVSYVAGICPSDSLHSAETYAKTMNLESDAEGEYLVAEVRALAGEGSESQRCNSADAAMTAAASGRGAPNTPGAVAEYPQTVYGPHSAAQVDITKESAQGLSEAERGRGMSGCPTGDPDHCDICWDAYIDERDAKEAE